MRQLGLATLSDRLLSDKMCNAMDAKIRSVALEDTAAICAIYNYYVQETAVTFETVPVSEVEMETRVKEVLLAGLPYLVIEVKSVVVGYCYLHEWNRKSAYSTTKELTIYLHRDFIGCGLGTRLFRHLLDVVDRNSTHVLLSGITIPNEGSVRLHEKFGFKQVSHLHQVGWKLKEWRDVGHWELII